MTKRIAILAALVAVALTLAGCGYKPPVQWNETEERLRVVTAMDGWAKGVEDYNVGKMAGSAILAEGFELLIYEGTTLGSKKDAIRLRTELDKAAEQQASYREQKGYVLRLDIDTGVGDAGRDDNNVWTITSINRTNAKVTCKFEVYETADDLSGLSGDRIVDGWWNSDNGTIEVTLVRTPNAWKMTDMKIVFRTGIATLGASASASDGLGIGRLPILREW